MEPPADGTRGAGLAGTGVPSLMEVLEKNPTLFAAAETARMSLPDDYDSDNDSGNSSVGPYTKRLGKRELRASKEDSRRTERMELGGYSKRSRKRTQDRIRRMDPGRGPGDRKRDNADGSGDDAAEPHLYMTEEEREAWKEEQRLKKEEEKERLRIKKEKEQEKEERRRLRREEREKNRESCVDANAMRLERLENTWKTRLSQTLKAKTLMQWKARRERRPEQGEPRPRSS